MTAATTYEIGTTLVGCATLTSLHAIEPESTFSDFSSTGKRGNGIVRAIGFPSAQWHYGYLTLAQYNALRAFCPTAGAAVYIATLNNNMAFVRYSANMEMPAQFIIRSPNGRKVYMDVTINFSELLEAE